MHFPNSAGRKVQAGGKLVFLLEFAWLLAFGCLRSEGVVVVAEVVALHVGFVVFAPGGRRTAARSG